MENKVFKHWVDVVLHIILLLSCLFGLGYAENDLFGRSLLFAGIAWLCLSCLIKWSRRYR